MSINVLERTKEIGMMRAIGATGRTVRRMVVVEGGLVALLSWILGTLLAYPISQMLSRSVGLSFLQTPLSYRFAPEGALIWLVAVLALAAIASLLPARDASRVSVRDVLAYE
jgi:putative ABC transport system permease protein